ncbi:ribonuclease P protein component [Capnocytophaga gingivalis]|uniref:ribonuclease P protein component n=1 Tax=Capnocytophaga gingivalis TaxID=1017 RepID=UPI0028E6D0B3|nr:ribonuclease P protein component [Capnocytophaga gingivalis]
MRLYLNKMVSLKEKRNTFPKAERLCNYHRVNKLFREAKVLKKYPLKLLYTPIEGSTQPTQLLISVPKRLMKKAVDRNRMKRLIRESYRHEKVLLSTERTYSLALLYMSKEELSYREIYALVGELLKELSTQD